ncbi:melanocyte-stimulating hormone receptor-like [Orbicella faveolata]|uniref:melanocyte-stimulating hormone receptor-like n=1 Tax=Orbicella faveolata TaxID=48498 RepID=UPI0009E41689|nr:melanocyte-stimulating hormone receptor-like [Orbicella faveolata]
MGNSTKDQTLVTIGDLFCKADIVDTHQKILVSALNVLLSVIAFLGNMLIIVALQKPSSLYPPSKLLLGCLASTDLCVGLVTQPLHVIYLMPSEQFKRCHLVGILSITIGAFLGGLSLFTLTAISVDRLLALLLGLRYRQVVTLKRVWILVVSFSLSNAAISMTFFYGLRITAAFTGIAVAMCMLTSVFCYAKIYSSLRQHQVSVQDHIQQGQPNQGKAVLNLARYRKTVSSVLWVQLTLVACYLPHIIVVTMFAISGSASPSLALTWAVTLSLVYFNSSLNPFLYCWKMREVRKAVKNTISQFWRCSS